MKSDSPRVYVLSDVLEYLPRVLCGLGKYFQVRDIFVGIYLVDLVYFSVMPPEK